MIVAIDYDKTYDKNPSAFNEVIAIFHKAGDTVICVTSREYGLGNHHVVLETIGKVIGESFCVFAGKKWKRDAARQAGFEVDIWIDDMPSSIERQYIIGG